MGKVPSTEELLRKHLTFDKYDFPEWTWHGVQNAMIEFAKLHVDAALKAAAEKAESKDITQPNCDDHTPYWGACVSCGRTDNPDVIVGSETDKDSILNAYPPTLIQ